MVVEGITLARTWWSRSSSVVVRGFESQVVQDIVMMSAALLPT